MRRRVLGTSAAARARPPESLRMELTSTAVAAPDAPTCSPTRNCAFDHNSPLPWITRAAHILPPLAHQHGTLDGPKQFFFRLAFTTSIDTTPRSHAPLDSACSRSMRASDLAYDTAHSSGESDSAGGARHFAVCVSCGVDNEKAHAIVLQRRRPERRGVRRFRIHERRGKRRS